MSENKFIQLNYLDSAWYGVADVTKSIWIVEPEYTWKQAENMANILNANPAIDPDELYRLAEVAV